MTVATTRRKQDRGKPCVRKARIGFIGAGNFISSYHLLTATNSEQMEIRAIADIDEERLEQHAKRVTAGYTTTDYRELLSDEAIDIVIVGTKQNLHAKLIIESLNADKWVFCEKPMAETEEESEAVLAAEAAHPGRLAIGFNRRFAPAYADAKRLMQCVERPWYLNYRLMYPNPDNTPESYYRTRERILYEGCHILDLVCWFLDAVPVRVFMTGDRFLNNCCILEFDDDSRVSFMCGSMGSTCLWKEYMEVFAAYRAVTVSEFTDMRVRGFEGEFDRLYPPYLGEHAAAVMKYGFDFFETYLVESWWRTRQEEREREPRFTLEKVRRPIAPAFDVSAYHSVHPDLWAFCCDKGHVQSLEHFVKCFLDGKEPENADGRAGALSTRMAHALLQSLESGQPVSFADPADAIAR